MIDDTRLAERLRDADLLSDAILQQARDLRDSDEQSLYEVLITHELVDEEPLVAIVSNVLNVAAVDPRDFEPNTGVLDLVPAEVAFDNWALPLQIEATDGEKRLVLAMRDPIDMMAMDEIAGYTNVDIRPVLAGPRALYEALVDSYDRVEPFDLGSSSEGLSSGTDAGMVTSRADEDLADDDDDAFALEFDSEPSSSDAFELEDAHSSPAAPADSDLGTSSDPAELSIDSEADSDSQIGRIPVKQVPASELDDESSAVEATLGDPHSEDLPTDSDQSSPDASEPPLDLGTPISETSDARSNDRASDGGTLVAKAPQVGDLADSSAESSPDSEADADADTGPSQFPPTQDDSDDGLSTSDAGIEPPDTDQTPAPVIVDSSPEEDEDDEPAEEAIDESSDVSEDDDSDLAELAQDESSGDDASSEDAETSDDEASDSDEGALSSLRRKLNKNKSSPSGSSAPSAPPAPDNPSSTAESFVVRVAEIADSLDDDARDRLKSASPRQLAEGAVLALLDSGALSAADLVEHLDGDGD